MNDPVKKSLKTLWKESGEKPFTATVEACSGLIRFRCLGLSPIGQGVGYNIDTGRGVNFYDSENWTIVEDNDQTTKETP